MIARELRVQRQIHQAALLDRLDFTNRRHRLRTQLPMYNYTHTPRTFGDEDASVGGESDSPGNLQIGGDRLDSKLHGLPILSPRDSYLAFATPRRRRSATGAKQRQANQN